MTPGLFFHSAKKILPSHQENHKRDTGWGKQVNFIGNVPKEERDPGEGWVGSFFTQMTGICDNARECITLLSWLLLLVK